MRKTRHILKVVILVNITFIISCSVKYIDSVSVPRYDSSPFNFRITHLWTGISNPIYAPDSVIRIWSDNGEIDTATFYLSKYNITPKKNGTVNIYTIETRKRKNAIIDTIKIVSKFKAINPPKIIVSIDKKLLKDSSLLKYELVFEKSLKSIKGTRYQLGALPLDIEVFKDNIKIGSIAFYTQSDEEKEIIKNGNRFLFPSFTIRDMKTDLIIGTKVLDFKYK